MIAVSLPSNVGCRITFQRVFDLTNRVSCEQVHLDRYIASLEAHTGLKAHRGMIARRALELFLETHEPGKCHFTAEVAVLLTLYVA